MIVGFSRRRSRVVAIVLGDVMLLQISIGIVIVADCGQPQLLDQPVLMGTVRSTRPLACGELAAMMRIPSLAHICPNWVTAASPRNRSCTLGRRTYTFFQSVYKARGTPYDPGTQQMGRRPVGFPRAELAQHRAGGVS